MQSRARGLLTVAARAWTHRCACTTAEFVPGSVLRGGVSGKSSSPSIAAASAKERHIESSNVGRGAIELYDAIVHDGTPVYKLRRGPTKSGRGACLQLPNGPPVDDLRDEALSEQLDAAVSAKDAAAALEVLNRIEEEGYAPSAASFLCALETCVQTGKLNDAENLLQKGVTATGWENAQDVMCSARSTLALEYLAKERANDALRVLGWYIGGLSERSVACRIERMHMGKSEIAWGCTIRALTEIDAAKDAVEVARIMMESGVQITDSLVFFIMEALRQQHNWKQADALFRAAGDAGITPHERTVGSLLRILSAPRVRRFVSRQRILELTKIPENPTPRFLVVCLIAFASIGEVEEATRVFAALEQASHPAPADERAFSTLIGAYSSKVELGVPDSVSPADMAGWYGAISKLLDDIWNRYMRTYGDKPPDKNVRGARSRALQRYLWAKARCMGADGAVKALEEALADIERRKFIEIGTQHFAAVLAGIEIACDTPLLARIMEIMQREGFEHDHRTLAFCVGARLGQGDTYGALRDVQEIAPALLAKQPLPPSQVYQAGLLRRRLEMLEQALRDARDTRGAKELARLATRLERNATDA